MATLSQPEGGEVDKKVIKNSIEELEKEYVPGDQLNLGPYTTQAYYDDPVCLSFITSRYKF